MLLHLMRARRTRREWRRRIVAKGLRGATKVQLRRIDRTSVTHQHVAKVGIEAAVDRGSPKASREINGQPSGVQSGQAIEMGRMVLVLMTGLTDAKPTIIQVRAHGRAHSGGVGMSSGGGGMVGRNRRGRRGSTNDPQSSLINVADGVGSRTRGTGGTGNGILPHPVGPT